MNQPNIQSILQMHINIQNFRPKAVKPEPTKENIAAVIISTVCECFGVEPEILRTKSRKQYIVIPRQICFYFMTEYNVNSSVQIGKHFGGLDHTTVLYGRQTVLDRRDTDEEYKMTFDYIAKHIKEKLS